jgi:hypothetical protein
VVAESSWPSPSNGHIVDDIQYEKLGMSYGPSGGVVGDFTSPQLIYGDSSGRQIKVAADRYALVRGHEWWSGSSIFTVAIGANASGSTRIDLVVLRLSRTTWDVTVTVIAGTPGSGVPPAAVQNTGTTGSWDLPLATVTVTNGAATITAGNVVYVGTHLNGAGGFLVPSVAALAYVPTPLAGQQAVVTGSGIVRTYNGTAWKATIGAAPHVLLFRTSVSIANNSVTTVSWTSDGSNDFGMWDAGSPTIITVPFDGVGLVTLVARWASQTTVVGFRQCRIDVGGVEQMVYNLVPTTTLNSTNVTTFLSYPMDLTAGDQITAKVYQNSGAALNLIPNTRILVSMLDEQ